MQIKISFISVLFSLFTHFAWGQAPLNDDCSTATVIADPSDYCTPQAQEDNSLATDSGLAPSSCFLPSTANDVWYSFTAIATELLVVIRGFNFSNQFNTMQSPQVALYSGSCGNLTEIACAVDLFSNNNLPLFASDLIVGQQYFIRVDADLPGIFQCCVKNADTINVVSSDCPTATFVCSKKTIVVEAVFGPGNILDETNDADCFFGFGESSSTWYEFTAANAGDLEFTLTPSSVDDDIDFVLYRLPNGQGNCEGKVVERCMAAGSFTPGSPCSGPTGLNATSIDIFENPSCQNGQDNFLQYLTLIPGETYALLVNNFTADGNGFTLEWGGTALFQGKTFAKFVTDDADRRVCVGEEFVVTDSSYTDDGFLTSWHWDFGLDSNPDTSNQQGPHTVQFETIGPKEIILAVTNDEGCVNLDTTLFLVKACCVLEAGVQVVPGCPDAPAATATVLVENAIAPLSVLWSDGQQGDSISIAVSGDYNVVVEDVNGCRDSLTFMVNTPLNVGVFFPQDTTVIIGQTLDLEVTGLPITNLSVSWYAENGDSLFGAMQSFMLEETSTYYLVANHSGCVFTDSLLIVFDNSFFKTPNAFTPNGDGSNDNFGPILFGNTLIQMEVWARWGLKVFDSEVDGGTVWDGTINGSPAPSDVYVYRVRVRFSDGREELQTGDVSLLR